MKVLTCIATPHPLCQEYIHLYCPKIRVTTHQEVIRTAIADPRGVNPLQVDVSTHCFDVPEASPDRCFIRVETLQAVQNK